MKSHRKIAVIILVLLVIVILIFAIPRVMRKGDMRQDIAQNDIAFLAKAVNAYHSEKGVYPSQRDGLDILVNSYVDRLPIDPWGRPYVYVYPGEVNKNSYDLLSYGADGLKGGVKENSDITNYMKQDQQ